MCHKTPLGPVCACNTGYRLAPDRVSCVDVNECEDSVCSQICHNTQGSFICSCESGYVLQKDKISCKATGKFKKQRKKIERIHFFIFLSPVTQTI